MWLIKGLCLGYTVNKPCVRGASYMRLISWTLWRSSKHFGQITFSKKFLVGIAMPLKILIKMLLFCNLKILAEPQQPGQDNKYRTVRTGQKSQDINFKFAKKNLHTATRLFSHCPKIRQICQCLWEQQVTQRPTFQTWRGDDA